MPDDSDSDYYGAGSPDGDATTATASTEDNQPQDGDQEDKAGGDTAMLPKSIFGDNPPAVGATCTFKVEHLWEDEVEVSYVSSDEPADNKNGKDKSTMADAMSAMDQMNQPPDEE